MDGLHRDGTCAGNGIIRAPMEVIGDPWDPAMRLKRRIHIYGCSAISDDLKPCPWTLTCNRVVSYDVKYVKLCMQQATLVGQRFIQAASPRE